MGLICFRCRGKNFLIEKEEVEVIESRVKQSPLADFFTKLYSESTPTYIVCERCGMRSKI